MTPPTTRNVLVVLGLCIALFLGWQIPTRPGLVFLVLGGLVGLATLQWHGKIAVALVITTISSAFILPHPARPYVWELSSLFAFSGVITSLAFRRWPPRAAEFFHRNMLIILATIAYAVALGVLMIRHGAGLRVMGADAMGGRFYLQQIIMMPLPLCAILFPVTKKTAVRLVLIQILLSFSFIISEVFFRFQLPGADWVLRVVELQSDTFNFTLQALQGGIIRYQSLGVFAYNFSLALLILIPFRKFFEKQGVFLIPILFFLFITIGMGGTRRNALQILLIIAFMAWSQRQLSYRELFVGLAAAILALFLVYTQIDTLPLSVQRTLSFLPGLDVHPIAQADADTTMFLRENLREESFHMIREHLWEGIGLTVDQDLVSVRNPTIGTFERHAEAGRFYSGPLGIFATLGILPFVLFWILHAGILLLCVRIVKMVRRHGGFDLFDRMSLLIVAEYGVMLFVYIFFSGDATNMLKRFVPQALMLMLFERILVLEKTRSREQSDALSLETPHE